MKKSFLYLLGLIAIMAVSCTEDAIVEQSSGELRITGSLASDSRTTFVEGDGVIETHWNVGDYVGFFSDELINVRYKSITTGKTTEFQKDTDKELNNEDGKLVYAYYPYNFFNPTEGDSIRLPYSIEYNRNTLIPFLYGQAQIENNELNFQFRHLFAFLKIVISTRDIIKEYEKVKQAYVNKEIVDIKEGSIRIESTAALNPVYMWYHFGTNKISGKSAKYLYISYEDMDLSSDSTYTYIVPILPQPEGAKLQSSIGFGGYNFYDYERIVPKGGLKAGHVYTWDFVDEKTQEEEAEIRTSLESFYQKTNGDEWKYNNKWLSDEPIGSWWGVGFRTEGYMYERNSLAYLYLRNNGLRGEFPDELSKFMDVVEYEPGKEISLNYGIDISRNYLYGKIPDSVKNHERWSEWGWSMIDQLVSEEGELDLANSNLYAKNIKVENLFEDESTVKELYEIFKEYKLTQITGCEFSDGKMSLKGILENFRDDRVNLHLDYESKGLKTLFYLGEGTEEEKDECMKSIQSIYGDVNGITWIEGYNSSADMYSSYSLFFDTNGQLVYMAPYNPTCPNAEYELIHKRCKNFLYTILGEPIDHPEFTAKYYTSTDYSRDGEVITLQEATVGQGINITFLGEAFVDKDMESGGLYEQTMREAMEQFFSYEPYKSMRNRFNVYAVKAVSPNSVYVDGASQAINHNNTKSFEYAQKTPNANKKPQMVVVIYKYFTWTSSASTGVCSMYDDGSFVAYIYTGIDDDGVLMHEAGGHGFGQLLDEYVGYESAYPEDAKTDLDYRWNNFGIGANVDWRNDLSTVKWKHFLEDERYANENLGIYEGASYYRYGIYRPSARSMMSSTSSPFNAPSREAIYKRIMQRSEGEGWAYDYEEFVKFDEKNRKAASRSVVKPLTEDEIREYRKNHRPPTFIKGTWRDAMKNDNRKVVVPLR